METSEKKENFLERLQSLDHPAKQRWVVGLSFFAMVIIVATWFTYFNSIIVGSNRESVPAGEEEVPTRVSFYETMSAGAASLMKAFANTIQEFGDIFGKPKTYIIEPEP